MSLFVQVFFCERLNHQVGKQVRRVYRYERFLSDWGYNCSGLTLTMKAKVFINIRDISELSRKALISKKILRA